MGLFLTIGILLFQKPTVTEQVKKCWDNHVQGHCRKICKIAEMRFVLCPNGRFCCLSIKEVIARRRITQPPRPKPPEVALTLPQDEDITYPSSTPKTYTYFA
ncbi:beta-defensin 127 [Otolemur garnettii]|uniref:beta-defensin 127 n=1 Tax=Otolemur garnettii TaxID=30611 RepID=UPI0002742A0B|nr:beta-defensin 127 [Otolemur garnettii]